MQVHGALCSVKVAPMPGLRWTFHRKAPSVKFPHASQGFWFRVVKGLGFRGVKGSGFRVVKGLGFRGLKGLGFRERLQDHGSNTH